MNKILIILVIALITTNVFALRTNRPIKLSFPIKEEEVNELNRFLENAWFIQNGRYELDVVTVPKTDARDGELWIIQTGITCRLQWKANGIVWTSS